MIHTVKDFGIVNKAKVNKAKDVFLELSFFFDDPEDVGNLISGSSSFSISCLNIWKFMVHVPLKPGLENLEHYSASVWNECDSLSTLWHCLFRNWNENWQFPVPWPLLSFLNVLAYWVQHFHSIIFRIWSSWTGIPPPLLALFVVMLPKACWLHIPGCLALHEWSHHCDYLGHEYLSCTVLLCILATSS